MTIDFNTILDGRIPLFAVEFDPSEAQQGPALLSYRALLIGQKTASGTAVANSLHKVTSVADVITFAGRGSLLHRMAVGWFASNKSTEVWIGVLQDDGAAVAAHGHIAVSDANPSISGASADGTIALYLGGVRITVAVTEGDTPAEVATAISAAINAKLDCHFTATVLDDDVTFTARNAGAAGNSFDIRDSYRDGEELPANVALTYTQPGGGTTNPALATLIAALGDVWYHVIAHPYTDATSLTAIETELADRFGGVRMIDGVAVTAAQGSFATLTALGNGRNSPHSAIVAQPGENPITPACEFAAEVAALVAKYAQIDPARPFQTLAMSNALPPAEADLFTNTERGLGGSGLLYDGIATTRVGAGSVVQLERIITTYQTNSAGAEDAAYLDVTTMLTLMYFRFSFKTRMQTRYPRHKLADDTTVVGPGQCIMTPSLGKAEAIGWARDMADKGLLEDVEGFKTNLIVERDGSDKNRLNFYLPPDLVNQFIYGAAVIGFRL